MRRKNHTEMAQERFDTLYGEYDAVVARVLPRYNDMHKSLVDSLEIAEDGDVRALDLGIGTGHTSYEILEKFPDARVTGVDVAMNMVDIAKDRLKDHVDQVTFVKSDMADYESEGTFDICTGVLSIHHLTAEQKQELFKKVYGWLNPGGVFVIGDFKLGETDDETTEIETAWKQHLVKEFGGPKGAQKWVRIYRTEDIPESIGDQVQWLTDAGFEAEVMWTEENLAVIRGKKPN